MTAGAHQEQEEVSPSRDEMLPISWLVASYLCGRQMGAPCFCCFWYSYGAVSQPLLQTSPLRCYTCISPLCAIQTCLLADLSSGCTLWGVLDFASWYLMWLTYFCCQWHSLWCMDETWWEKNACWKLYVSLSEWVPQWLLCRDMRGLECHGTGHQVCPQL